MCASPGRLLLRPFHHPNAKPAVYCSPTSAIVRPTHTAKKMAARAQKPHHISLSFLLLRADDAAPSILYRPYRGAIAPFPPGCASVYGYSSGFYPHGVMRVN